MPDFQDYPKWVHGQIAQDAEDASRIEREWAAENPDPAYVPPAQDTGIAPSDVSQSPVPGTDEAA